LAQLVIVPDEAAMGRVKLRPEQAERQPDPKGDRVKLILSGKFLPYKEY
jgi:cyanate lyase